jgi:hypothetical protein
MTKECSKYPRGATSIPMRNLNGVVVLAFVTLSFLFSKQIQNAGASRARNAPARQNWNWY